MVCRAGGCGFFCCSDIDFFQGIQAEAAQPPAWVHTAAVNVDEALRAVNLPLGALVARSAQQKLRGGVSQHHAPVGEVDGFRFRAAPDDFIPAVILQGTGRGRSVPTRRVPAESPVLPLSPPGTGAGNPCKPRLPVSAPCPAGESPAKRIRHHWRTEGRICPVAPAHGCAAVFQAAQ